MTQTMQYARKVGGSLMVSIPKEIVEVEHISPGEIVEINITKIKKDWFGVFKGLKSLKKEEKICLHE